jgi:glycosyltransferase involved in cell wall biosynthesis
MPDVGVIARVPDAFDDPWQSRHQILTRLSHYFNVSWIGPAPGWRNVLRHTRERRHRVRDYGTASPEAFSVCMAPPWLPTVHRPAWLGDQLDRGRLLRAARDLRKRGSRRIVLSLWRADFHRAVDFVKHDLAVYHIDDEYSFSAAETPMDPRERQLIESADLVLVHSRELLRRKGHINPNTAFSPNGVDYSAFATPQPEPVDLSAIPRPRIAYTGFLKRHLDWNMLRRLIAARREWRFVFIGPTGPDPELVPLLDAIAREPNAHFLGTKSRLEIGAYPQHCDVCIMPYRADAYTRCIYPLKLHEYLASGRPVVGSRIDSIEAFGNVVSLASGAREWEDAVAEALGPEANTPGRRIERQAVAREHDWNRLVERIASLIAE